jgi:hypothetical protein
MPNLNEFIDEHYPECMKKYLTSLVNPKEISEYNQLFYDHFDCNIEDIDESSCKLNAPDSHVDIQAFVLLDRFAREDLTEDFQELADKYLN